MKTFKMGGEFCREVTCEHEIVHDVGLEITRLKLIQGEIEAVIKTLGKGYELLSHDNQVTNAFANACCDEGIITTEQCVKMLEYWKDHTFGDELKSADSHDFSSTYDKLSN